MYSIVCGMKMPHRFGNISEEMSDNHPDPVYKIRVHEYMYNLEDVINWGAEYATRFNVPQIMPCIAVKDGWSAVQDHQFPDVIKDECYISKADFQKVCQVTHTGGCANVLPRGLLCKPIAAPPWAWVTSNIIVNDVDSDDGHVTVYTYQIRFSKEHRCLYLKDMDINYVPHEYLLSKYLPVQCITSCSSGSDGGQWTMQNIPQFGKDNWEVAHVELWCFTVSCMLGLDCKLLPSEIGDNSNCMPEWKGCSNGMFALIKEEKIVTANLILHAGVAETIDMYGTVQGGG